MLDLCDYLWHPEGNLNVISVWSAAICFCILLEEFCMLTTLIYLIGCVLVHEKSLSDKKAHVVGEFRDQCI